MNIIYSSLTVLAVAAFEEVARPNGFYSEIIKIKCYLFGC